MASDKNPNVQMHVGYERTNNFLNHLLEVGNNEEDCINKTKNVLNNNINNKKCKYIIYIINKIIDDSNDKEKEKEEIKTIMKNRKERKDKIIKDINKIKILDEEKKIQEAEEKIKEAKKRIKQEEERIKQEEERIKQEEETIKEAKEKIEKIKKDEDNQLLENKITIDNMENDHLIELDENFKIENILKSVKQSRKKNKK